MITKLQIYTRITISKWAAHLLWPLLHLKVKVMPLTQSKRSHLTANSSKLLTLCLFMLNLLIDVDNTTSLNYNSDAGHIYIFSN